MLKKIFIVSLFLMAIVATEDQNIHLSIKEELAITDVYAFDENTSEIYLKKVENSKTYICVYG